MIKKLPLNRRFYRAVPTAAASVLAVAALSMTLMLTAQAQDKTPAKAQPGPDASIERLARDSEFRPEIKDILPPHRLLGKTRLTVWGFQIYDVRLWAAPGLKAADLPSQPFALELSYLRDFDSTDIAKRSLTEMRRSASFSDAQSQAWTAHMLRVFPNVVSGDRIMGVNQPGTGALFFVNGKSTGEIRDPVFARLFFGIWLSDKTSEPQMRDALLSGAM